MAFNNAGSIFALGLRLTKLDASGAPLVGLENCYVTDALVSINLGLEYSEPDAIELMNGRGGTCLYYQPHPTLRNGMIEELKVCQPDPIVLQFLAGGDMIVDGVDPAIAHIGWQPPPVNVDPLPNGVAIEAWSNAVLNNSIGNTDLPYWQWVIPKAFVRPSEAMTLGGEDPATPQMEGTTEENNGFGTGPLDDITFPSNRVWQFCQVATLPDLTPGFVEVVAPTP